MNSPAAGSHIALLLPSLRGGGAERAALELARGFVQRGLWVDMVLGQAEGTYLSLLPPEVRVINLRAPRLRDGLVLQCFRYLRRTQPTVLLSFLHYTNLAALLAAKLACVSTRVVICEQNTMSQYSRHTPAQRGQRAVKLMPLLAHLLYPHAQRIVAASAGVADDLGHTARLSRNRITVIYNPVVTPELLTQAAAPLDHPWFVSGAPPVIVGVGRLVPQKDFATLLRAFASVRQQHPARLLILGEGIEREQLAALASTLNIHTDVTMPGFVDNPFAYMARAALFVLSSRWEGLANVVIEALACGTPVVATDCPHGPREILAGGHYGALVPVGDSKALAAAMLATLDAPLSAAQLQARAAHFSRAQAVTRYLELMGIDADEEK